ncbi:MULTISPECIES: fimbria/pilus periplasmic chaperone [Enterobacter]|uniref:fimbria/pilus periplasmic chaperone n=1 Tax=Enterobacter TaxID=547 RepID=UPI0007B3F074|nr:MULTISPECIES: fimbria/pilus periplasmic chaperone [Enterobacter]KZQ36083.1 molecular chaperone [Enterobacter genomosp. O]MBS0865788.1 fimbria/pilus periplasmic chaperone [Enterobacter mori]
MKLTHSLLKTRLLSLSLLAVVGLAQESHAAIALDRTRVIFDGGQSAMSVTISNQNKNLPYLAQAWVEDRDGKKIETPMTALPPLQRVEPGAKGQVKIQLSGGAAAFPQDRESLMYFNVREIPPRSSKPNTLQIALQTRVKMFYRPESLAISHGQDEAFQKKLTLIREGEHIKVNNPTPYYVTIAAAAGSEKGENISGFKPLMIDPKGTSVMLGNTGALGSHPVLTFINDYGGRPKLVFECAGNVCSVSKMIDG